MKWSITSLVLLSVSPWALSNGQGNNQVVQQQQQPMVQSSKAEACRAILKSGEQAGTEAGAETVDPAELEKCKAAKEVADKIGSGDLYSPPEAFQTSDGRAICKRLAGYTMDYDSCESTARVYNHLLVASMVLEQQAEVRASSGQNKISQEAQSKAQSGDFQGASLEASKSNSSLMKQLNQEKAAAYAAAVAALGAKVAGWVDNAKDACKGDANCIKNAEIVTKSYTREAFANKDQKQVFILALAEYTAKGLAAGIEASKYKKSEETVAKIQDSYEEEQLDVQLDKCVLNPTAKECLGPGTRVSGQSASVGSGEFSLGGNGTNSFDMGSNTDQFGEMGEAATIESQQVAAINSPFEAEAKEANDILDKAAAASPGSGGGAAGGGGGGGGMGGGGARASLGNDTQTPDAQGDKEADIKAKKASGGYAAKGGGSGFSAVKSGKEDSNPFSSLFDQKGSGGGLEEDRTIASEGIDKKSSVLFQKISKKYSEMHSLKRIQANNLELE